MNHIMRSAMKIMVVDNDPVYLNLLAEVLRLHSFATVTAHNGEAALELLKTEKVDLVISDISMPKMNGINLYRSIRQDPELKNLRFAWNSGYRELRDVVDVKNPRLDFKLDKSMPLPNLLFFVSNVANEVGNGRTEHAVNVN